VILIAALLLFGFWPQPMIDVIHDGAAAVVVRINPEQEKVLEAAAPAEDHDGDAVGDALEDRGRSGSGDGR